MIPDAGLKHVQTEALEEEHFLNKSRPCCRRSVPTIWCLLPPAVSGWRPSRQRRTRTQSKPNWRPWRRSRWWALSRCRPRRAPSRITTGARCGQVNFRNQYSRRVTIEARVLGAMVGPNVLLPQARTIENYDRGALRPGGLLGAWLCPGQGWGDFHRQWAPSRCRSRSARSGITTAARGG